MGPARRAHGQSKEKKQLCSFLAQCQSDGPQKARRHPASPACCGRQPFVDLTCPGAPFFSAKGCVHFAQGSGVAVLLRNRIVGLRARRGPQRWSGERLLECSPARVGVISMCGSLLV